MAAAILLSMPASGQAVYQKADSLALGRPLVGAHVAGPGLPPRLMRPDVEGRKLSPGLMDSLTLPVLEFYELQGRINNRVEVDSVSVDDSGVTLVLSAHPGPQALLLGILISGRTGTRPGYLQRLGRLAPGTRLRQFDSREIQRRLQDSGLFASVGVPLLLPSIDSTAIVQLILEDRAPGSFDLALGYLPGGGGQRGSLVGSGNLLLRNLFGGGRTLSFELNRLPGQASSLDALVRDPFLFGLAAGGEVSFGGYQQDSTFSKQVYGAGLSLDLGQVTLTGQISMERVQPGSAGLILDEGVQRVADSRVRFAGLGMAYRSTGSLEFPTQGLELEARVLTGRKVRQVFEVVGPDTLRRERAIPQQRMEATIRAYRTLPASLVLVGGLDVRTLISEVIDPADLYRLGGAATLRGYDEDQFRAKSTGRILAEVRRALDGPSYTYAFLDVGLVDGKGGIARYPGYGIGIRLETPAGLMNVSYAMNSQDGPRNGRVHVGIAFGL